MSLLGGLLKGSSVIKDVTNIVDKTIIDKDKRNEIVYQISLLMLNSKIAPYVRAALGLIVVISIMFFGTKLTITPEVQQYALYSVLGYYFLDRVFNSFGGGKK